jgi:hypothetical protein
MHHHIAIRGHRLLRMLLLLVSTACTRVCLVHFHILVRAVLSLTFLVFFLFARTLFQVDFLALLARIFFGISIGGGTSGVVCATHFGVFTVCAGGFFAGAFNFDLLLFLFFFGAVLVAVRDEVGFRLVGRELGGC